MFQVESRAQMASLLRNLTERFCDLVVQVTIIRPGPIVGKMMHPYMRRQKQEEVTYPHVWQKVPNFCQQLVASLEVHSELVLDDHADGYMEAFTLMGVQSAHCSIVRCLGQEGMCSPL
jgi:Bacterial DNA polymerase III alpha subunit finger domain